MGTLLSNWVRVCIVGLACTSFPAVAVRNTRLTWVNGIAYSIEHMEDGRGKISRLFGGKAVSYCHNPTAMSHGDDLFGYLGDLTQAGTQKLGRITAEVDSLVRHLKEAVVAVGKKGRVVHIAHSQGALVTFLAAKQLSPLEMSQIEVIAFGGAAVLRKSPQTPFRRCVNYYAVNDPLLFVVPSAAQALKSGYVGDAEFCFLTPRIGDPIQDHSLLGPTYRSALAWEGQRFQRKYQSLTYRIMHPLLIYVVVALRAAKKPLAERSRQLFEMTAPLMRLVFLVCAYVRSRVGAAHQYLVDDVLKPLLLLVVAIFEWLSEALRLLRGQEKYVPVESADYYLRDK